tara:strand:- start:46 stop:1503 length:1458 start_codon:yes stop_codon:yes gene_type:complete
MATALNFGQIPTLTTPIDQRVLGRGLMNQVQPFGGAMAANRNAMNMMPLAQQQVQQQAQPVASGSGPAFRFQDLNKAYQLDPRNNLAKALMQQGMRGGPVRTPLEGIGRLSQSLVGAMLQKKSLDRLEGQETTRQENLQANQASILGNIQDENIRNTISALLPTTATESSNAQIANLVLGSALAPKQSIEAITNVPNMAGAKVVSTDAFGNESISNVNLAALPKAQEKFTTLTSEQAEALGYNTSKGQTYQQSNLTDKVIKSGGDGQTINIGGKEGFTATLKLATESTEKGVAASSSMANIDEMLRLLSEEDIKTGFGKGFLNKLNLAGQQLNPNFKLVDVAGTEAFRGFANQVILPKVKDLGSKPTDRDLEFVVESYASLSNSVAGNKFLLKTLQLDSARKVKYNQDLIKFIKGERAKPDITDADIVFNALDFTSNWYQTDPLMTEASKALKAEFKSITGQDADAVSSSASPLDNLIKNGLVTP